MNHESFLAPRSSFLEDRGVSARKPIEGWDEKCFMQNHDDLLLAYIRCYRHLQLSPLSLTQSPTVVHEMAWNGMARERRISMPNRLFSFRMWPKSKHIQGIIRAERAGRERETVREVACVARHRPWCGSGGGSDGGSFARYEQGHEPGPADGRHLAPCSYP